MPRLPQPKAKKNQSALARIKAARARREKQYGGALSTYKGRAAKKPERDRAVIKPAKPKRTLRPQRTAKARTTPGKTASSRPKMHASGMTQDRWDRFSGKTKTYRKSKPGTVNQRYYIDKSGRTRDEKGSLVRGRELDRLKRMAGTSRYERKDEEGDVLFSRSIPKLDTLQYDPEGGSAVSPRMRALRGQPAKPSPGAPGEPTDEGLTRMAADTWGLSPEQVEEQRRRFTGEPTDLRFGQDLAKYIDTSGPAAFRGTKMATPDLYEGGVVSPFGGGEALYTGEGQKTPLSEDLTPPVPYDNKYMAVGGAGGQAPGAAEAGVFAPGLGSEATERYQRELEQFELAEQQARENLEELTQKYAQETDEALQSWDKSAEIKYGQKMEQAAEDTKRTTEEMMRFKGAKGTARSSRTMDAVKTIQEKGNEIQQQLLAERDAARRLYEMQLRGASGDALAPYAKALQEARTRRQGAEAVLQKAKQGLLLEQQKAGQEARLAEEQQYIDYLKEIGMTMDPRTGETVQTLQSQLDRAEAAKDMADAEKTMAEAVELQKALDNNYEVEFTTDARGNRMAVWYDPSQPGELQTTTLGEVDTAPTTGGGSSGGGGGSPGGGGAPADQTVNEDYVDRMALQLARGGFVTEDGEPAGPHDWGYINEQVDQLPVSVGVKKDILDRTAEWKLREVE